ncbi:MAG: BrxE family protein [Anaerolineaceae bacterium]|nr:BrxE family protein [Anaerolineaceae bacterium]
MTLLNPDQAKQILQLRFLIARAAQKDSLRWWDDDSLTPAGGFLFKRLFMNAPEAAGRKLAIAAAKARYHAAFNGEDHMLHLFRLDLAGEVENVLNTIPLTTLSIPDRPITILDGLRQDMDRITGDPTPFQVIAERANSRLEIQVADKEIHSNPLKLAQIFAWASLRGEPGAPIFPYIVIHHD